MFIVCRFDPPCGLVFMSALFLLVCVNIETYVPLRPCSYNHVIGISRYLILGFSLTCLTCEITTSLSSYAGVGWPIGDLRAALNFLYCINRLIPMKYT